MLKVIQIFKFKQYIRRFPTKTSPGDISDNTELNVSSIYTASHGLESIRLSLRKCIYNK